MKTVPQIIRLIAIPLTCASLSACATADTATPSATSLSQSQSQPPRAATAAEKAAIVKDVAKVVPANIRPELSDVRIAYLAGGGSDACGLVHGIEASGRQTQWTMFERRVSPSGKSDLELSKPGEEQALMDRCAAKGLALEN